MSAKVFLDTNILVYSYSNSETRKQVIARTIIEETNSFISSQVLQELVNTITRKFGFSYAQAVDVAKECLQNNDLHINTEFTIVKACKIAERYGFSFYDSLIISAAIESECTILYSEDMNNGQEIEGKMRIVNPFING